MRRAFIVIASIVLIGIVGAILYFFFGPKEPALTVSDGAIFGSAGDTPPGEGDTGTGDGPIPAGEVFTPQLIRITDGPVALGAVAVALQNQAEVASGTPATGGDVEVRYIDRASGNVYAYRIHERTLTRISNRTLPGIQEATWLSDGSQAFVRFLAQDQTLGEQVQTYALPASGTGGYFLDRGVGQVGVSGTTTLYTLLPSTSGSIATIANIDGSNPRTLFSSSLSSLILHHSNGPFIAATKASANIDGYAFTVGANGSFTRILGPLRGLSVLPSPSGNLVLYSYIENRVIKFSVLERTTGTVIAVPITTLADKCVWSTDERFYCGVPNKPIGTIPDDWYQGVISFSDRLWEVDMVDRSAYYLIDPMREASTEIDMTGLSVDARGDVLIFKNKRDGSLWSYDL